MSKSRAQSVLGGHKKEKSGKGGKVHKMHIRRAANGGFIVEHEPKKREPMEEPEEHQIGDMDQLKQHVEDNMGDQPEAAQPGEPDGDEAQSAGAPAPMQASA